ncbi:MAG: chlorite dismutase family protein [Gemmatimonadaceae bacterium]
MNTPTLAHPPATLEGWYALHQIYRVTKPGKAKELHNSIRSTTRALQKASLSGSGKQKKESAKEDARPWSCFVGLIGSIADVMVIHFRESLDDIESAQKVIAASALMSALEPHYAFLSVTEAGLYHISAELARSAEARGGKVGDETYARELAQRSVAERASAHVRRRLYPERPNTMPYVCFYPMSKRRDHGQNWYTLSLDERSRLMQAHGITGRRYAGLVQQVITGAIGLDAWEWGVTLFAADPLDIKKLVTDMRFDEVSAKYAEFGQFYVGRIIGASG